MRRAMKLLILFAVIFVSGCAVSTSNIRLTARDADFPISLTESVYDKDYRLLSPKDYEVVHHFELIHTNTAYTAYFPTRRVDLSEELRVILKSHSGDAITNLRVYGTTKKTFGSCLSFLTLGILAPAYVKTTVEGDVIKLKEQPAQEKTEDI